MYGMNLGKGLLLSLMLATGSMSAPLRAQSLSRHYQGESLSHVLEDLNLASREHPVSFIYDDLEHYTVNCRFTRLSILEAVRAVVGFYPIKVSERNGTIYVESAGKHTYYYKGRLIDERSEPIAYANLAVFSPSDTTLLGGGVSTEDGTFVVPSDHAEVILRVSYLGCQSIWRHCTSGDVGTIQLHLSPVRLAEVPIEGQAPVLLNRQGTLVFNPRSIAGAMHAADLLPYTPGVSVDGGDIRLFGSGEFAISVNGRRLPSDVGQALGYLSTCPASSVEKIEVHRAPSARFSAEGAAGIINFVVREQATEALSGQAGWTMGQSGVHSDEGNANIVYSADRLQTSLSVSAVHDPQESETSHTIPQTTVSRHYEAERLVTSNALAGRWQLDWQPNRHLGLAVTAMAASGRRRLDADGTYRFSGEKRFPDTDTHSNRRESTTSYAASAQLAQHFADHRGRLDYGIDYYRHTMTDSRETENNSFNYANRIVQDIDNCTGRIDLRYSDIRLGGSMAYTGSHRNVVSFLLDNPTSSMDFRYNEHTFSAYAEYARTWGRRWECDAGVRYEYTRVGGDLLNDVFDNRNRNYGHCFPSLHISFHPDDRQHFSGSFSSRITRPNIISVNADTIMNDAYQEVMGNTELKPSYAYKALIGYQYGASLSVEAYFDWQTDCIGQASNIDAGFMQIYKWLNVEDQQRLGIHATCQFQPFPWLRALLMQRAEYTASQLSANGIGRESVGRMSIAGAWQFFWQPARKWQCHFNIDYQSATADVMRDIDPRYSLSASVRYSLCHDRLQFSLSGRNLLASRIKGKEYDGANVRCFDDRQDYRRLLLSVVYRWGTGHQHQARRKDDNTELRQRIENDF